MLIQCDILVVLQCKYLGFIYVILFVVLIEYWGLLESIFMFILYIYDEVVNQDVLCQIVKLSYVMLFDNVNVDIYVE